MTRRIASLLACAALAAVLAACGEKQEPAAGGPRSPEPFTVVLDYLPNADHAGIYAAQATGEFRRAGLDVRIVTPSDPAVPLKLLQAHRADLAITYPPELLLARDRREQLLSVGALVQQPLTTLMAIGSSGVHSPADLRGKTVGTAGIPYQTAYLKTILARAGVPASSVKQVDVGFSLVPTMVAKRVDATLGAFWNYEAVDLRRRGRRPVVLRMERFGVPTYPELVFAARRTSLHPDEAARIRRFLQAVARGTRLAVRDPAKAADALLQASPELDRGLQLAAIRATAPVFLPGGRRPFGWQDRDQWHAYGEWMRRNGLLRHPPAAEDAFTNEFLPGQGIARTTAEP